MQDKRGRAGRPAAEKKEKRTHLLRRLAWQTPKHCLHSALVRPHDVVIHEALHDLLHRLQDCAGQPGGEERGAGVGGAGVQKTSGVAAARRARAAGKGVAPAGRTDALALERELLELLQGVELCLRSTRGWRERRARRVRRLAAVERRARWRPARLQKEWRAADALSR